RGDFPGRSGVGHERGARPHHRRRKNSAAASAQPGDHDRSGIHRVEAALPAGHPRRKHESVRGSGPMMRVSRSALVVAALCAAIGSVAAAAPRVSGVVFDNPTPVQAFALNDQDGKPFTADSLKGHWSLVLAGFTNCPDVCPFTLANLEQVVAELGLRVRPDNLPTVIFLAVDPERDRANLKDYVVQFHPDFIGITGAIDQIDRMLTGIDAVAVRAKPDARGNYQVTHSAAVAVIDPQARLVAKVSPPFDPAPTAQFLADLLHQHQNARVPGSG